jgi:hypothetical protein
VGLSTLPLNSQHRHVPPAARTRIYIGTLALQLKLPLEAISITLHVKKFTLRLWGGQDTGAADRAAAKQLSAIGPRARGTRARAKRVRGELNVAACSSHAQRVPLSPQGLEICRVRLTAGGRAVGRGRGSHISVSPLLRNAVKCAPCCQLDRGSISPGASGTRRGVLVP